MDNHTLSADPGGKTAMALFNPKCKLKDVRRFSLTSKKGPVEVLAYLQELKDTIGDVDVVLEAQYARKGRSSSGLITLAARRGFLEYVAKAFRWNVELVQPVEWKRPVCTKWGTPWNSTSLDKDDAIMCQAAQLYRVPFPLGTGHIITQDEADAIMLGYWHLHRALFL